MIKLSLLLSTFLYLISPDSNPLPVNIESLTDNNPTTFYTGTTGINELLFEVSYSTPVLSYKIYSTGELPAHDPANWRLKGSNDKQKWTVVDERRDQTFCSRFQEKLCVVQNPESFTYYALEVAAAKNDTLKMADVILSDKNLLAGWEDFNYPKVDFETLSPNTEGSKIYHRLVQDPDEYIKYHALKVSEILYFTNKDSIVDVQKIKYTLEDKEGVSAKGGSSPDIYIFYSTQHIEKSAKESLHKLDMETRGVLYHELTHGYQYEPKGIGNYGNNKTFWACIEGVADAVRAEAGLFDMSTRKPGGNWMDGYRTTGFFLQWLTTKDPDAIRKFHRTAKDLDVWSFDGAIKSLFGPESSIEGVWAEYQEYLIKHSN